MQPSERPESRGRGEAASGGGHQDILNYRETRMGGEAPHNKLSTLKSPHTYSSEENSLRFSKKNRRNLRIVSSPRESVRVTVEGLTPICRAISDLPRPS